MAFHQCLYPKAPWYATTCTRCIEGQTYTEQTRMSSVQSDGRMDGFSQGGGICLSTVAHEYV